jgi:hypothetical protein
MIFRNKLVLPPPKSSNNLTVESESTSKDDDKTTSEARLKELELLKSVMGDPESEGAEGNLFFIDTTGGEEQPHSKRRRDLEALKY